MSETKVVVGEEDAAVLVSPSPDTAGAMLRKAREKAGLHVAALAVAIKIPVKKLEALEADQLLGTHDLVFTRALASSVCRTLKIDAKPVLAALPQTVIRELHVDDNGINAPFSTKVAGQPKTVSELVSQPWAMLVIALCAGALVIAATGWWGQKDQPEGGSVGNPSSAEEVVVPQAMAPVVIPAPTSAEAKTEQVASSETPAAQNPVDLAAVSPAIPAKPAAAVSTVAPSFAAAQGESKPAAAVAVSGIAVTDAVMSFKARQQSVWVQVVDAKGEVRLRRNIAAGERVECGGVLPLVVVLGRAYSVDVEVRGRPFDFSSFARDNVARFEVK
jgi:cytoskeleton protein RodZ